MPTAMFPTLPSLTCNSSVHVSAMPRMICFMVVRSCALFVIDEFWFDSIFSSVHQFLLVCHICNLSSVFAHRCGKVLLHLKEVLSVVPTRVITFILRSRFFPLFLRTLANITLTLSERFLLRRVLMRYQFISRKVSIGNGGVKSS